MNYLSKLLGLFLAFSVGISAKAQISREVGGPKAALLVNPTALIDVYGGGSIRAGIEARIKGRWSAYGEGGWYYPNFSVYENAKGGSFRVEGKRYFHAEERGKEAQNRFNGYLAAGYFFKSQQFNTTDTIDSGIVTYPIEKTVHAIAFKLGGLHETRRFVLDSYIGVGVRHKRTVLGLTTEEADERHFANDSEGFSLVLGKSNNYLPHFEAGIRLGIKLNY